MMLRYFGEVCFYHSCLKGWKCVDCIQGNEQNYVSEKLASWSSMFFRFLVRTVELLLSVIITSRPKRAKVGEIHRTSFR